MTTANVNGITIGYDDTGTGDDVLVLVHGHPFDRTMWRPQIEHFSRRGHRVIAADLRGYGESTVVPGITTLDVFANDIAALLDHLDVDRFVLGGLSMGGQIVMQCVQDFPERLTGLILADTFARPETAEGRRNRNAMADRLLDEGMSGYANEVKWKMVARHNPEAAEFVAQLMHNAPPEGAAAALRGRAERPDYTETLKSITVPTLVIVGSDDEYTPVEDAEYMHERIATSTLEVVEGAAHMPNVERPEAFNRAVEELLAQA
ncbi:alpha/beta hydrolase [Lentzea sp. NBRC 102530]|uniref:alpha/beta fold hydrolase n=1 Tax=Lentzea sp. NBRC 102530 TaxID=3032201 RepID=UPI0024A5740C|nr:alpha/beta hydrolase [Lentzea sp. NBRC 102530]GLY51041.1 alpha/beta hydrolase [Lentzea sp. NBRC 102530]